MPSSVPPSTASSLACPKRRSRDPRAIGDIAATMTRSAAGPKAQAFARVIDAWPAIAGTELSRVIVPLKLVATGRGRPPRLDVAMAASARPLWQHVAPQIEQRLQHHLGLPVPPKIRVCAHHAPSVRTGSDAGHNGIRGPLAKQQASAGSDTQEIDRLTREISDPALRDALRALGQALLQKTSN